MPTLPPSNFQIHTTYPHTQIRVCVCAHTQTYILGTPCKAA